MRVVVGSNVVEAAAWEATGGQAVDAEPPSRPDVPLAETIQWMNGQLRDRRLRLNEPFVLRVSRDGDVPAVLLGTFATSPCDGVHAGRCRRLCDVRYREWRADLDCEASRPDGAGSYKIAYQVHWTSQWYRDR